VRSGTRARSLTASAVAASINEKRARALEKLDATR
jgi:hypothetical protein